MRLSAATFLALAFGLAACDRLPASRDAPAAGVDAAAVPADALPAGGGSAPEVAARPMALAGGRTPDGTAETLSATVKPQTPAVHTPALGSSDRMAMMDSLRAVVRPDIGGDIVFVVRELRSNGTWAFAVLEPTRPNGRAIPVEETPIYRRSEADELDGLRIEAIWSKDRGVWRVRAHAIGSTDVWWTEHCSRVPQGVLTGC
jgi:hypothetical protein